MKNIKNVLRIMLLLIMFLFLLFSANQMRYSTIYCECVYASYEDIYADIDQNRDYHHRGYHDNLILENYFFGDYRNVEIESTLNIEYFSTTFGKISLISFFIYMIMIILSFLKFKNIDGKIKNNIFSIVSMLLSLVLLINQILSFNIFQYNYCIINGELTKVFFTINGGSVKPTLCNIQLILIVLLVVLSIILLILNYVKNNKLNNNNS